MSDKIRDSFKVTHDDCRFEFSRSSGAGGQNVNKRSTKARCTHPPSGAVGMCQDHREQHRNKTEAFQRMARTPEFQRWAHREAARRMGTLIDLDEKVAEDMHPDNITIEVKDENGRWKKVSETFFTSPPPEEA
ncbi:MAG: peptide chain release factor family protein [Burkholderiaceae bacterium]